MKKSKIAILALLLSLTSVVMAEPQLDSAEPEVSRDGDDTNKTMVMESEFTQDKYTRGDYYNVGIGERTQGAKVDEETGEIVFINYEDNSTFSTVESNLSEEYKQTQLDTHFSKDIRGRWVFTNELRPSDKRSKYYSMTPEEKEAAMAERTSKLNAAKAVRREEMINQQHTQANYESTFVAGLQSATKGTPITQRMLTKPENVHFMGSYEVSSDTNVTNFYSQNYGYRPYNNSQTAVMNSNAEIIKKAYNKMDEIESDVKSDEMIGDLLGDQIQCYISREMVPAYYCPFPSKNNVIYPDYIHTGMTQEEIRAMKKHSPDEAFRECNENCKIEQSCKTMTILDDVNQTFPDLSGKTIWPTREMSDGIYVLEVTDKMAVDRLSYTIKITPSEDFNGTAEDFERFLRTNRLKFKYVYTLIAKPTDTTKLPEVIVNRATQILNTSQFKITIPLNRQVDRYVLKFYRPYIYPQSYPSYMRKGEAEFFKNIDSVKVEDIRMEFASDSLHFCPVRQFVDNTDRCDGEVLHIKDGTQIYNVCLDNAHKIGPDQWTGGFFTEGACANACYKKTECLPTYRHYTDLSNKAVLFNADIGCVDSKVNIGCKKDYCVQLFQDDTIQPVDEILIYNDNTKVYTIKHFDITDVPRPKIDVEGEELASTEEDYNSTFQKEMKDAAFRDMLERQNYNRIKYKIGEESPVRVAHEKVFTEKGNIIFGKIKPRSFAYDSGNTMNIYSVMKLYDVFKAKYGQFYVREDDGTTKIYDAQDQVVFLRDIVYLVDDDGTWRVFRRVYNDAIRKESNYLFCPNEEPEKISRDELTQQEKDRGCFIQKKFEWARLTSHRKDKYVRYDTNQNDLVQFSSSEKAKYLKREEVISDTAIKSMLLADTLESVLEEAPGAHIRRQITKNNGATLTRVFNTADSYVPEERGMTGNVEIYLVATNADITYSELSEKLNDRTIIYDHINRVHSKTYIPHDGEINNRIETFIMGAPEKTTIQLKVNPTPEEYGKRTFKFLFLFDDGE